MFLLLQIVYYCVKLVFVGTPEGKEQKNPPRESREKKIQFFISPLTRPQSRDGGQNIFTKNYEFVYYWEKRYFVFSSRFLKFRKIKCSIKKYEN